MFNWKVVTIGSSVLVGVAVDVGVHMAVGVSVSVGVGRAPPAAVEECCPSHQRSLHYFITIGSSIVATGVQGLGVAVALFNAPKFTVTTSSIPT